MTSTRPLLEVDGLTLRIGSSGRTVVNDVGFSVSPGEIVGIVGESGSGKTLAARAVMGFIPPAVRLISGSIRFDGEEVTTMAQKRLRVIRGARVGILDADITGPSIPRMLGLSGVHATGEDEMLVPVTTKGAIKVMSANLVLESETDPVLWRGPVVANAIEQFYSETIWGDIDYLLVDMPPGTSDVALTVFQSLPIEGVVIVSSPQDLVQMVVGKAVNMANMMRVPILGLVENMAYLTCPHCGEKIEPYGPSRLAETAESFGITPLGQLPIDPALAAACDEGTIEDVLPEDLLPDAVQTIIQVSELMDAAFGRD